MDVYNFTIDFKPFAVKIISIKKHIAVVEVNGKKHEVDVSSIENLVLTNPEKTASENAAGTEQLKNKVPFQAKSEEDQIKKISGTKILSPMPGQVVKIYVKDGDNIKDGDVVMIVEAMKMENEVKTEIQGTVKKIHVEIGDTVSEGDLLVSLGG